MIQVSPQSSWLWRPAGATVVASLVLPALLAGCGSPAQQTQVPVSQAPMRRTQPVANTGMSTRQKVTLLAGAAGMYYLYRKYQRDNAAKLANQKVVYYLSKNGRVYYRDPKTHEAIYVTPAPDQARPVQLPASEAGDYDYSGIQGYNNAQNGKTLKDYFKVQ